MLMLKSTHNKILDDLAWLLAKRNREVGEARKQLKRVVKHNKSLLKDLKKARSKLNDVREVLK